MPQADNPFVIIQQTLGGMWEYISGIVRSVFEGGGANAPVIGGNSLITLKLLSIALSALLLAGIIVAIVGGALVAWYGREWREFLKLPPIRRREMLKVWERIQKRIRSGHDAEMRLALIEADKLWDELLRRMGYDGETTAERMKYITAAQFANIEDLWAAHKLRNRLVHDTEFPPRQDEILRAIEVYEKAFRELQLIE